MLISIKEFEGEYPRVGDQILPENAATLAQNTRLLSGNITAWQELLLEDVLCKVGTVNTVYLMDDQFWLEWLESELGSGQTNVDVARMPLAQDTTERTIFTGTDAPRVTNIELATGSTGCYPQASFLLGVPAPLNPVTLVVNGSGDAANEINVENGDAEEGDTSSWIATGSFIVRDDNDVVGLLPQEGNYFFGSGNVASTTFYQDIPLSTSGAAVGQTLTLTWWQASGAGGSTAFMSVRFLSNLGVDIGGVDGTDQAITPANTWEQQTLTGANVVSGTETIRVYGEFTRVGGTMDAYIDDIVLAVTNSDFSNDGSDLSPFQRSPEQGDRSIIIEDQGGSHGDVFRMQADEDTNYLYKNFALTSASSFTVNYDFQWEDKRNEHHLVLGATASGVGQGLKFRRGEGPKGLRRSTYTSLADTGTGDIVLQDPGDLVSDQWYKMNVVATKTGDSALHLVITVTNNTTMVDVVDEVEADIPFYGDYINWKHWSNEGGPTARMYIDNINVTTVPAITDDDGAAVFTNYVYTYVNEYGEEGPPSPVSDTVQFPDGGSVTLTFDDPEQPDYNLTDAGTATKRIYRAVTGNDETSFLFVDEIPLEQDEYIDDMDDDDLGEELETVDWDLPPTDGSGVIALPNGITAMFSKNQLCPSVINHAHAYPVLYRLNFDSNVVAIAPIDTSVVVGTRTYPYIVLGSDPSAMSSTKLEQRQACASKRSMVSIRNYGVVYASPDGLVAISGAGTLEIITAGHMSRKEWQALVPESIIGFAHDDRYYGFYDNGTPGGFIFDPRKDGNGLTFLNFEAIAGFSDPMTDILYLYTDGALYAWDEGVDPLTFRWDSKEFQLARDASFRAARIRGTLTTPVTFRVYINGSLWHTRTVTNEEEFVIPSKRADKIKLSVEGTSEIRLIEVAEKMDELR